MPPLIQSAIRSLGAALLVALWSRARGIPLMTRDGTLLPGIAAGVLFALELVLLYQGLVWTTASRAALFLYCAPFFAVLGTRWFLPADRFPSRSGSALGFRSRASSVVSVTYLVWFALIIRYSASRLSAFTFLTPLLGVAAGHLVLNEPLTPACLAAAALVAAGVVLVNRPR